MTKIEENKKPVNEQETRNLILQIQSGDTEAENRLVDIHKGFTASVTRQYQGQGLTDEEITSACESAMKRAAKKNKKNNDFKFRNYAIWRTSQSVLKGIQDYH